ncbi:TPA: hypothetical protein ACXNKZ_001218 [Klebsiella pneumoniae]|uniref:hypothetical protein n=1 Tax=Klebsiella pneumoniae TaxID=573 RepID=UPI000B95956C|nr:hypothetical protein [Klebsiella pneumoniae]MCE0369125.1 hypothetical protein [Klebsiella pneumoniae]OYJ34588.1 hypothetical protein CI739_10270 [Klebsiella pneumoniae subsp. pneumoniae]HBX0741307.1 hypothetical protein [Klebsiella pneumoniae]HBX6024021.1 hypothetical protein [Klebsiella pneumoniae]HBZ4191431.1 hypothetical protein [Klebsiella pneumoniae]
MKERGMIFNGEMVRAILDGRKTQTRRPVRFPVLDKNLGCELAGNELAGELSAGNYLNSAFGRPGDRIWVRETWAILGNEDGCYVDWEDNLCKGDERSAARIYRASCEQRPGDYGLWSIPDDAYWKPHTKEHKFEGAWRPSIHMPRWASRILLEITDVRVERLNAISEEDARAEGIIDGGCLNCGEPEPCGCANPEPDATDAFAYLWQSIYGQDNWNANPWVWVIEFKRVEGGAA